jgi:competence protein ComEA
VAARRLASGAVLETPRHQLALCAVGALVVLLLGARYLGRVGEADPGGSAPRAGGAAIQVHDGAGGRVTVHVAGAVRRPGVYRLSAGARVDDAVERAGGPRRAADLSAVNLAAKLEDGRQVIVPARAAAAAAGSPATGPPAAGVPLNLNTATLEQLDGLDGIGPATAQTILAYREEHGGFGSVDELAQVPGIGEKRMATLREQVRA